MAPFPTNKAGMCRLISRDKIDARSWRGTALDLGYDDVVIHDNPTQKLDQHEFILIYRAGQAWARWGAARQGATVKVWRCSDGRQVGLYRTMQSALRALPAATEAPELTAR